MTITDRGLVQFPASSGTNVNMMPVVMGDLRTLPTELHGYAPMMRRSPWADGAVVYLTVHESMVRTGTSQRRGGVHTERTARYAWGGGGWGKHEGVWMASTDGACRAWDEDVDQSDVNLHGGLLRPVRGTECQFNAGRLYSFNDSTPHEALTSDVDHYRQFYRLVGPDIDVWYAAHSTPSPFGVLPRGKFVTENKFA